MIFFYNDTQNSLVSAAGGEFSVGMLRQIGWKLDDVSLFRLPRVAPQQVSLRAAARAHRR